MAVTVGVVGLGIMGSAFSGNLLNAEFQVVGFDILTENIDTLVERGGVAASSPQEVAEKSDFLITSLPSIAAFHEVMTGEKSIHSAGHQDLIVIECSTLPIEDKQKAHDALAQVGTILLDCPISGTGSMAVNKDLAVYASGDRQAVEEAVPVFEGFARSNYYVGEFGNGSKMKFVANHLVQIHNVASAEAMVLGMKAGLEPDMIYKVISDGAGTSRVFEVRAPMMVKDDYSDATMKIDVWKKDIKVISEFAANLQCPTPLFSSCTQYYLTALAQGRAKQDTAAVCAVFEDLACLDRVKPVSKN